MIRLPGPLGAGQTKNPAVLYIGLTGGIGSGKSTLALGLQQSGAIVFSADQLARDVVAPGTDGLEEVVEHFSAGILTPHGSLDRGKLGRIVFTDPSSRTKLEQITHPRIAALGAEIVRLAPPGSVVVYDVPLLIENQMESQFDLVMVVDASLENRLERLAHRGLIRSVALERIAVQATEDQRLVASDIWVKNDGTEAELGRLGGLIMQRWFQPAAYHFVGAGG